MVQRGLNQGFHLIARILGQKGRGDRAAVHPDPYRHVVIAGDIDQPGDLLGNAFGLFDVVQMAGVVTDLVHIRGNRRRDLVVLLEVNRQG